MNNWDEIDTYVREWLEEAREKILASFSTSIEIETKSDRNDLVTKKLNSSLFNILKISFRITIF